jgi:hypothetical protein
LILGEEEVPFDVELESIPEGMGDVWSSRHEEDLRLLLGI